MTGSGTPADPFVIETVQDLQDIELDLDAYYLIDRDIDAAGFNFDPIPTFQGNLNGAGYRISNLTVNKAVSSGDLYVGLFQIIGANATVEKVRIQGASIIALNTSNGGQVCAGVLAGVISGANITVRDIYVQGTMGAQATKSSAPYYHSYVGGVAGELYASSGSITRLAAHVDITATGINRELFNVGGVFGICAYAVTPENLYAQGMVINYSGHPSAGTGGLVGKLYESSVSKGYSTGFVGGGGTMGGLIGVIVLSGTAPDSFWDKETSGRLTSAAGTGKTTLEMRDIDTYTVVDPPGLINPWDFVDVWGIGPEQNDGYPYFLYFIQTEFPPHLIIEYIPATPPVPPKLTVDFDSGIEPIPPKLTIEHEYLAPMAPKLIIEHEAVIEPVPPKLTIDHELPIEVLPPKLTIEYVKPTIPEDVTPGIQIYVHELWEEISQYVMSLHTKRGRMHELDRVEAGTSVMILNNETGIFWRYNPDSPYFPEIKPIIRVRIVMALGEVSYSLFNGVIEAWRPSWSEDITGGLPIMTIECVDMFKRFSRAFIREARPAELPGQRINAVLSHIGWPAGEGWRAIDPGCIMIAELPLDEANPENALQHMLDVAQSEGGILFIDGEGKVVFQDSNSRITGEYSVTKATLTKDDFLPVQLSDDDTMIYNAAQVNSQLYQIPDFDPLIGPREYKETLPISTETDALARAYMIAQRYKDSILRLPSIPILPANNPERLYPMVYGYELSSRIKIELDDPLYLAKIEQTYHIEGIQHKWDARSKLWRTEWQVWEVSQFRRALMTGCAYAMCTRIVYQSVPGYVGVWPHPGNLDPYNNDSIIHVGQQSGLNGIYISRGLVEFDTAGVTAEVTEAHVFLCFSAITQGELDRDIKIVLVDPESLVLPMQTGDYGILRTKETILGESADFSSARDGDWIEIELNAAGLYHIEKGGTTRFGIRSNHDINADDDDLQDGEILFENAKFYGYGTGKEPYLVAKLNI